MPKSLQRASRLRCAASSTAQYESNGYEDSHREDRDCGPVLFKRQETLHQSNQPDSLAPSTKKKLSDLVVVTMPRRRGPSPPWSDVLAVLHMHLKDAADELGITMCHLKFVCHSNGLHRWPGKTVRSLNARLDRLIREAAMEKASPGALPRWADHRRRTLSKIAQEARTVIRELDNIYERIRNPVPELPAPEPEVDGDGTMNLIDSVGVSGGTRENNI